MMPKSSKYLMLSDVIEEWGFDTVKACMDVWVGTLQTDSTPDADTPETMKVQQMMGGSLRVAVSQRGLDALDGSAIGLLEFGWFLRERWEALQTGEAER